MAKAKKKAKRATKATEVAPSDVRHHVHPQLHSMLVPVADLHHDERNARVHNDANLTQIMASYTMHGQRKPLVGQRTERGIVIRAGNGQLEAARRLGWTHVAVLDIEESDAEATAFALRDNRTAEIAEWDVEKLGMALRDLRDANIAADTVGWDVDEAESLMEAIWGEPAEDDDAKPPKAPPRTTFLHRIMVTCADEKDQEALLGELEGRGYKASAMTS